MELSKGYGKLMARMLGDREANGVFTLMISVVST